MTDEIHIEDLLLRTFIGINPEEREKRQDVLINLTLFGDLSPAGASDHIEDAINYRSVTKRIIRMVEASRFYLVERLATEISTLCFIEPGVERVTVRVEKPGALRFARSVGVTLHRTRQDLCRQPHRVFISLGSNIEPEANLPRAVSMLHAHPAARVMRTSSVYRTTPVGRRDQPAFLNAAVEIRTVLAPAALKTVVLDEIERALARKRTEDRYGPRTIDLDISLYDYGILEYAGRHIPDPDVALQPHVAIPLAEIAPYYVHPETEESLAEVAARLSAHLPVQRLSTLVLDFGQTITSASS